MSDFNSGCISKSIAEEFNNHSLNIVFGFPELVQRYAKEQLLSFDESYKTDMHKAFKTKSIGPFKLKGNTVREILMKELKLDNKEVSRILDKAGLSHIENSCYTYFSDGIRLILSLIIDAYNNKKHFLLYDEWIKGDKILTGLIAFLLPFVKKNNGSIVWITKKELEEIDDCCIGKFYYTLDTCFYKTDASTAGRIVEKYDRKFSIYLEEDKDKADEFIKNKKYNYRATLFVEKNNEEIFSFLKFLQYRYISLSLVDIIIRKVDTDLKVVTIGVNGINPEIPMHDLYVYLKDTDKYFDESAYEKLTEDYLFINLTYVNAESAKKIEFLIDDTDETVFVGIETFKSNYDLERTKYFTAITFRNYLLEIQERINFEEMKKELFYEFRHYQSLHSDSFDDLEDNYCDDSIHLSIGEDS